MIHNYKIFIWRKQKHSVFSCEYFAVRVDRKAAMNEKNELKQQYKMIK